jgi:hypothetical protein
VPHLTMPTLVAVFSLALLASKGEAVELTIVTPKGHVSFAVEDEWKVVASKSKMPVAVMAFQVPDPFDEGTPESTNVAVTMCDPTTLECQKALKLVGKKYGNVEPKVSRRGEWQLFEQEAPQNDTPYTILDLRREAADVTVSVRLAWPHLKAHSNDHDGEMRALFGKLLTSVHGALGPYQPKPGEVGRRPAP